MRDIAHHLKYVQKKLLQEARRESFQSQRSEKEVQAQELNSHPVEDKKFDPHHRTPRVFPKRDYH